MRTLSWLGRIGLVTVALVLLSAGAEEAPLSSPSLCASESGAPGNCTAETGSYCVVDSVLTPDFTSKT